MGKDATIFLLLVFFFVPVYHEHAGNKDTTEGNQMIDKGYKAVMITDSAFFRNPHYHLPSDTMDKLDYRFMAELVESLMLFFKSHQR